MQLFFYFLIFANSLVALESNSSATFSNHQNSVSTEPSLEVHSYNCTVCLTDIQTKDFSKPFECSHTTFHYDCGREWVDSVYSGWPKIGCPICKARPLFVPHVYRNPLCPHYKTQIISDIRSGYSVDYFLEKCIFSSNDIHKFTNLASSLKNWKTVLVLLKQREDLTFVELSSTFHSILLANNAYTVKILDTLLANTGTTFTPLKLSQHRACLNGHHAICNNAFLKWLWYKRINVSIAKSESKELILNEIKRDPWETVSVEVLMNLPSTLIDEDCVEVVMLAMSDYSILSMFHFNRFFVNMNYIIKSNRDLGHFIMPRVLKNIFFHGSRREFLQVLNYKFFTKDDIAFVKFSLERSGAYEKWLISQQAEKLELMNLYDSTIIS